MAKAVFIALLLVSNLAYSQIYRTTDEHGNVVFTDTPPADGTPSEEVELSPTNTTPATAVTPRPVPEAVEETAPPPPEVTITSPSNETTIPMGPGNFSVSARVEPELQADQSLQLNMDGAPVGEPQKSPGWDLTNVFRGAHDLTVSVIGSDGEVLSSSQSVRVYVLRPSVNFRNRN